MSVLHSSRTTPRTSASHGRIVTENSTLSAALRENSDVVAVSSAPPVSVHSPALDVVSSHANISNASTNPTTTATVSSSNSDLQYVVVSKSRLSLNSAVNTDNLLEQRTSEENRPADGDINVQSNVVKDSVSARSDSGALSNSAPTNVVNSDGSQSNRYSYHSLKSRENTKLRKQVSYVKDSGTFHAGDNGEGNIVSVRNNSGLGQTSVDPSEGNQTSDSNTYADVNSRSKNQSRTEDNQDVERDSPELTAREEAKNSARALYDFNTHEPSLIAPQFTRLSLNSQHDRVSRDRVPFTLDDSDKAVPPLDLNQFSRENSPDNISDPSPVTHHSDLYVEDQNLHASDRKTSLTYFSPHDTHATGRKTYEVESPVLSQSLPHVKSSADNFRESAEAQGDDKDTYRDRQQEPDNVEPARSDLADDLNIPVQFDTQRQTGDETRRIKPPSPPVQTTPPPSKEPATSLRSSQVYAVANPEIQRAQGTASTRRDDQVRFDQSAQEPPFSDRAESRVKDRAPTPYARSPQEVPRTPPDWNSPRETPVKQDSASKASKRGLPPQHPPIDTLHTPKSGTRRLKNEDTISVKRVYVESPSFTKEEEEEYRFVSSRLDDIDDKNQQTFREMDNSRRGYGGDDMYGDVRTRKTDSEYERNRDRERNEYDRRDRERDRYDRFEDQNRDRYEDRNRDRMDNRYDDRNKTRDSDKRYDGRSRSRSNKEPLKDRYEDRTREMNGYSDYQDKQRRDDRDSRYDRSDEDRYEKYERLRNEREDYNREMRRDDEPDFRGYQKQNTELDEQELRKETEYQKDLKRRIEKNMKVKESRDGYGRRGGYDKENDFPRDSLEYSDERERGFARDSLEYNNYDQAQEWDNPPQNPYQEGQYYQPGFVKQDSKPDFYDAEDAERMDIVNPKPPKYDYVEKNKQDYGMAAKKTYRDIVHRKREEEDKLDHVFVTPKVPSKPKRKAQQKSQSAQPQHMGYQPPPQYPLGFKPSSAEEVWEKRAQMLSVKKESAQSNKPNKGSAGKGMPRWNSNPNVKQPYKYEPPPPLPNTGQPYRPPNAYKPDPNDQGGYSQQLGGYGTPTRNLQPLENKPAPPANTELVPTAVNPQSPFRRHMELKPITQEITTEDGQRISVDINLRLISPPPGPSGPPSPHQHQQQLALVPVQETQPAVDQRGIGVPYQMQDVYGNYDNGYGYTDVSSFSFCFFTVFVNFRYW